MAKLSYGFVSVLTLMLAATGCARDSALAKSEVRPEQGHDVTVQSRPGLSQVAGSASIADIAAHQPALGAGTAAAHLGEQHAILAAELERAH